MDISNGGLFIVGGVLGFILMWGIIKKVLKGVCLFTLVFLLGCGVFSFLGIGKSDLGIPKAENKTESSMTEFLIGDFSEIGNAVKSIFE